MKRYMIELQSQSNHDKSMVDTRRETIAIVGRYLASTPKPCAIMILRRKKEVKNATKNKRRAHR